MKLTYRGASYDGDPQVVETTAGVVGGKDRCENWRFGQSKLSDCRFCRHYQPTGRRGGMCQLLGVPVKGSWKAC